MIQFKYLMDEKSYIGKIDLFSAELPIEADIQANGYNYHIIVGNHINGKYICIPNWYVGSELAQLDDYFWNQERLSEYTSLGDINAQIVARALAEIDHFIKQ